jgi:hypothetical protein
MGALCSCCCRPGWPAAELSAAAAELLRMEAALDLARRAVVSREGSKKEEELGNAERRSRRRSQERVIWEERGRLLASRTQEGLLLALV